MEYLLGENTKGLKYKITEKNATSGGLEIMMTVGEFLLYVFLGISGVNTRNHFHKGLLEGFPRCFHHRVRIFVAERNSGMSNQSGKNGILLAQAVRKKNWNGDARIHVT